jgi:hypothetical protein
MREQAYELKAAVGRLIIRRRQVTQRQIAGTAGGTHSNEGKHQSITK